eukprot:m.460755 g.460755  ORF g.460755 m.460755 type:complete len:659 (-) comp22129_c0_seq1:23-1999(-)
MDDVPLTSPEAFLVDDDEDDLLAEIEGLLSPLPSSPNPQATLSTPPVAAAADTAIASAPDPTSPPHNEFATAKPLRVGSGAKRIRWPDDTSEGSMELEDFRAFDKREPVADVSTPARDQFDYVLVEKIKAQENIRRLYISHGLSAWGDRMWEFAIALLLISIWPGSLLLVALFGFTEAISVVLAGPVIGDWVDTSERLAVVRISLVIGNGMVVLSAGVIGFLLRHETQHDGTFWMLVVLLLLGGSATRLASVATNLAVEKEWVKLICADDTDLLAATNAGMRRIDLLCKLLAPICVGGLMAALGPLAGCILIGLWHCVLLVPEYLILTWVYGSFSVLRKRKRPPAGDGAARPSALAKVTKSFVALRDGWTDYTSMEIFKPAMALALLYCTVLSFGSLFTAYAYHRGVNQAVLAVARGIGAGFGLLGTFGYPALHRRYGTTWSGGFAIWLQLALLSLCLVATWVGGPDDGDCSESTDPQCQPRRTAVLVLLIAGVITSRLGLWMFDLAVSQMLQERVPIAILATVNGTQSSMQELLDLLGYVLGLVLNRPDQFFYLVYISFGSVLAATLLYTSFWRVDTHDSRAGRGGTYSPIQGPGKPKDGRKKRGRSKRAPNADLDESLLNGGDGEQFHMEERERSAAQSGSDDDDDTLNTIGVSTL